MILSHSESGNSVRKYFVALSAYLVLSKKMMNLGGGGSPSLNIVGIRNARSLKQFAGNMRSLHEGIPS